jgi:DNA-directed RNA polymerase subunit RPC12/RpoP
MTGDTKKYAEIRRRIRRRFLISFVISVAIIILNFSIIVPQNRGHLGNLLAAFGVESLLTILLIVWIFAFRCPRCGQIFLFPPKRKMSYQCVHCGLSMGAASDSSDTSS